MASTTAEQILTGSLPLNSLTAQRINELFPIFGLRTMSTRIHLAVFRDILITEACAYAVPGRSYVVPVANNIFVAQAIIDNPLRTRALICSGSLEPLATLPLSLMQELLRGFGISIPYRANVSNIRVLAQHREQLGEQLTKVSCDEEEDTSSFDDIQFQVPTNFEVTNDELGLDDEWVDYTD